MIESRDWEAAEICFNLARGDAHTEPKQEPARCKNKKARRAVLSCSKGRGGRPAG